ncbi:MAG TPA: alpha/beta fold hydrolase [Bryobacteraceae bacterium]|nr:alpha/beta fold hydrolase [Bryobacteraceae bacterium]
MPGLPPIIDRELLFGDPEISGAQLSPDGHYVAFLKPWKETRNVWVKRTDQPFASARLMTTETARPVGGYLWTRDSKYIVYVKDKAGDENFNVYAVDPGEATASGADAPSARDLTNLKGVRVMLFSAPKTDPDVIYIGLNDRDPAWHDLYKLRISTGERTLIRANTDHIAGWIFDLQGNLRLAQRVQDSGDQEILRVDESGFISIYTCGVFENCGVVQFHKDGRRAYFETNKGDLDLMTLALLDPASGQTEIVESDPEKRVDLGSAWFSEATDELVATVYSDDQDRRYFRDPAFEADYKWLEEKFSGQEISITSSTRDERQWLIAVHGDTEPGETYLFSRAGRTLEFQYKIREKLPRESLAPMQAVHYASSDGLEVRAYLTLPKGIEPKSLPALLVVHGGPWARDHWGYSTLAQFFANRGYAVLMPNFRGSTGYGKQFLNAGNGEWGAKMQDDLTWGVKYLVAQGIADAKRIGILGGSYGGYATLAGVAFTPDVYRAAVDIVGPSNLVTLLATIPPYWEAGRKIMYARMADPGTPAGKQWLEERSPLNSATHIQTPLMVVQGANDPRVNRREAEQIVIALRDRGFPIEYLCAPDEGHGFARPVNNLAMFMAVEKFLAAQLGGRYQEGGSPEATARLNEITVDPRTVVLSEKLDASQVGVPAVAAELKPGVYKYDAKIAMGGQQMALKLSTTIQDSGSSWTATENIDTPMGAMLDTAALAKGKLTLQKRSVKQGPVTIDLDFSSGKAVGTMTMNGQSQPVAVDLDGPLFADAAGANFVIGCLPLAEGYTTAFRNFDVQQQKIKLMQLQVAGSETVTVPAGAFDAFKIELSSAEGGPEKSTVWIAKNARLPVKISTIMPEMGGATLTAELLP